MDQPMLSVLFFREADRWVAQCLEYDISAQAKYLANLPREFRKVVYGHMEICAQVGAEPFVSLPRAPKRYWNMGIRPLEFGTGLGLGVTGRSPAV